MPDLPMLMFPPVEGEQTVIVSRVVDGDTIHFGLLIGGVARLHGIDAPEVTGPTRLAGLAATEQLRKLIQEAGCILRARIKGKDKYGRTLMELYHPGKPGVTINDLMIETGHAKPYDPDKRPSPPPGQP